MKTFTKMETVKRSTWRWTIGIIYIVAVALIWIAASFVVQSVVDDGVSPFLVTYICNSLFVIYIPIVEVARLLEPFIKRNFKYFGDKHSKSGNQLKSLEKTHLLHGDVPDHSNSLSDIGPKPTLSVQQNSSTTDDSLKEEEPFVSDVASDQIEYNNNVLSAATDGVNNTKSYWSRKETAKASLLICPFWFMAQLTFNLSLKYTSVTSNTILSSTSSLFTFLVSLVMLNERFTWVKLFSVLLCMIGTIVVSLGDTESEESATAPKPVLGDFLCVLSAVFYAIYTSLIRKKLPDEEQVSTAHFLGFLGLFNMFIFFPVALILHFSNIEPFHSLTPTQFGLITGKGLLDNVFSDYLWAKAVLLTTPTVATAGLTIQVPLAALIDSLKGNFPNVLDYVGGTAILLGFFGMNKPQNGCCSSEIEEPTVDNKNGGDHEASAAGSSSIC